MLSISIIIFFSVVLFLYWFRYSCLLILQDRASYATPPASGTGLNFAAVQQRLRDGEWGVEILDQLRHDLSTDYRMLCFLLRCTPDTGVDPIERRMLMLDYWIMQTWYSAARRFAPPQARSALQEMSNIVSYFAHSVARHGVQHSNA